MFTGGYYNPYMFSPYQATATMSGIGAKAGLGAGIKGLFKGFNFNNFLTSTGKTLNVINQAIPIFYQVKPIVSNAKTMLKVVGAVRGANKEEKVNSSNTTVNKESNLNIDNSSNISSNNYSTNSNNPTFFL